MEDKALSLIRKYGPYYAEYRQESVNSTSINLKDKERTVSIGKSTGVSVRMIVNGSWGMASSDKVSEIENIFRRAFRLASISKGKSKIYPSNLRNADVKQKVKINPIDVSIEQKVSDSEDIKKLLSGKNIKNRSVRYMDSVSSELFVNSEGTAIRQSTSLVYLSFSSFAAENGVMEQASGRVGRTGGYETVKSAFKRAEQCPAKALALLSAKTPPPGKYPVVVDGRMTGLLCHEALGHACEADGVIAGSSILESKIGKNIASPLVTIYDDPAIPSYFGSYSYDDEGIKAERTELVSKGKLVSYLHSRETAEALKSKPTGNARTQSYSFPPIVRMSNTCMGKGKAKKSELFEGIKKGIYALGMSGGCVDTTTGYFVFSAEEGYLIENGRKKELLRDVLLSGNVLDSLCNVDMAADDFSQSPGMCGKMGQGVPVSDGGPHIRINGLMVGGKAK